MAVTPTTTLLRFVNVRPIQKRDELNPNIDIVFPDGLTSKVLDELRHAASAAAALQAARAHIRSDQYVPGFAAPQPWVAILRDVWAALASIRDGASLDTARTRITAIARKFEAIGDNVSPALLRVRLWESLFAVFVAPDEDPRDRAELIRLLRALEVLRRPDVLDSVSRARRLAVAPAIVPSALANPTPAPASNGGNGHPAPGTSQGPVSHGGSLDQFVEKVNVLRQRYVDLDAAIRDLESSDRRVRHAESNGSSSPALVETTLDPSGVMVARTSLAVGRLTSATLDRLKPQTRTLVESAGLSLEEDRLADITSTLGEQKSEIIDKLHRLGGAIAIADLEPGTVILDSDDFDDLPHDFPTFDDFDKPIEGAVGTVKPLGMGDLLVLKESVIGYELGEIAYIENVLQSESRSRVHRRLDRVETTFTRTTTVSEESERDLTTNERFALSTEVERTVKNDLALEVGLGVSASYGVVKVDANTDFAISSSVEESQRSSTEYSQEITDRSVSKLTKSITETLSRTVVNEIEETNTHTFDNSAGTGHIAGLYRYVDKKCQAQVFKYGQRLMVQFIIPQPAEFHVHGHENPPAPTVMLEEPDPLPADFGFKQITRDNYHVWVKQYQVKDVSPPPTQTLVIGKAIEQPSTVEELKKDQWTVTTRTDLVKVPEGYYATDCWVIGSWNYFDPNDYEMIAVVGKSFMNLRTSDITDPMYNERGEIPIAFKAKNVRAFAFTVEVECQCTNEHLVAWKIETWQKIVEAYNAQKAAYDAQITSGEIQRGNEANATPPAIKHDVIETELRKHCLVLLTNQHFASMDAIAEDAAPHGYPEIRVSSAMHEGSYIQWFEHLFEWNQMTYTFYPYFWGSKSEWVERSRRDDSDPTFAAFLRAGAARVIVPVRLGYDAAFAYYLETGQIWNGGEVPVIDDELYVSIVDEMAAALDVSLEQAEPWGEPWEYTLPTSLVMLQADSTLPTFPPPAP